MPVDRFDHFTKIIMNDLEGGDKVWNDPVGGLTKFGISARAFPGVDVANLDEARSRHLYREVYWKPIRADELPPSIAFSVFDFAINSGTAPATKVLQRLVGVTPDGVMGDATIEAVKKADRVKLAREFNVTRARFLRNLTKQDKHKPNSEGWANRMQKVAHIAGRLSRQEEERDNDFGWTALSALDVARK